MGGMTRLEMAAQEFSQGQPRDEGTGYSQHQQRQCHAGGRFVGVVGALAARLSEEGHEHQAAHVEGGQHGDQNTHSEEDGIGFQRHGEDLVLGVKSAERRKACQSGRAQRKGPEGLGHLRAQTAHLPNVLLVMAGMDHGTGTQEEHRLETGMSDQMVHRGRGVPGLGTQSHGHDHQSQLGERGVGEDALDVILLDGNDGREQRGESADASDDRSGGNSIQNAQRGGPARSRRVQEEHSAKHVHASRDHGGGMDEGRNGRRTFHGVRQPHVQRELRALAHGSHEDQQAGQTRPRAEQGRIGHELGLEGRDVEGTGQTPNGEDAQHEAEVADAVGEEGLFGGVASRGLLVPEAN